MGRNIETVHFPDTAPKLKRVAAYARVSSGKDAMLHSLSAQISEYSSRIQNHPGWQYAGVYADEAKTGTKDSRENFQRLVSECRAGNVDMVITKSISRFARNTVTLLETVRELKALGVDVFFEEQNIHTLSGNGEVMMSILASFAQAESQSASENQKWRIRKNFEEGKPWDGTLLGYRMRDGKYIVVPEEAETVRRMYSLYLSGKGVEAIAKILNADGLKTRLNGQWSKSSVSSVLKNYSYTGNLILQKTYRENYLTKRTLKNDGVLPKYHAQGTHEPIIDIDTWNAVQEEFTRRAEKHAHRGVKQKSYPFTGIITCGCCGKHYHRKATHAGVVWICDTYNHFGKDACPSKAVPEPVLERLAGDIAPSEITAVRAENGNRLVITTADGSEIVKRWQDRSRAESWTPEMKEAARQKALARSRA